MHLATISSQRQITLPKLLLDQLSLDIKDRVKISAFQDKILIEPDLIKVSDLAGSLGQKISPIKKNVPFARAKAIALKKIAQELANE